MKNFLSFWVELLFSILLYSFLTVGLLFFLVHCVIHAFLYLPLFGIIVAVLSIYIGLQLVHSS